MALDFSTVALKISDNGACLLRKNDFHPEFNTLKCEYKIKALHTLWILKLYLSCILSQIHNTKQGVNQERKKYMETLLQSQY